MLDLEKLSFLSESCIFMQVITSLQSPSVSVRERLFGYH